MADIISGKSRFNGQEKQTDSGKVIRLRSPEEEKDILFDFLSKHTDRLYKYSEAQDVRDAVDPRAQNEDLGDDPVRSSLLGIDNLNRSVPKILHWTTTG